MTILFDIILIIIGFVLLIRGADAFVDGASALARRWRVPEIIIGLTVVAMGTSFPEMAVTVSSAFHGANGMAVGNILGSNIANILLILGMSAVITPLMVGRKTIRYEIPFVIFITIVLMWFGMKYGAISRLTSGILLALFALFLGYLYFSAKETVINTVRRVDMSWTKILLFIILGVAGLVLGSNLAVNSALELASALHVPNRVIGLTLVAFGTSLPELVTCIAAARKKHTDLIIGNIIGSNVFNILFVLGLSGLILPINFEYSFLIDAAISVVVTIALWIFTIYEHSVTRMMGVAFLAGYIAYLMYVM
jgi:cation:H+ antiporter